MKTNLPLLFATFISISSLGSSPSQGASATWVGEGANGNWTTAENWNPAISWGTHLTFSGVDNLITTNDIDPWRFAGITFAESAGAFHLSGYAIQLNGPLVSSSTATQTLAFNGVTLLTDQSVEVVQGGNLVIQSPLDGNYGLIKNGAGSLTFAGATTYTGATQVNKGTLILDLASQSSGVLASNALVTLENAGLVVKGASTGLSQQALGSVQFSGYRTASGITVDGNGGLGTTLSLDSLGSHTAGQSIAVNLLGNASLEITNAEATINGVYSHIAITDGAGSGFATRDGNKIVRNSSAAPLPVSGSSATGNYTLNGNHSLVAETHSLYTLAMDTTTGGGTLNLNGGSLVFSSGGAILLAGEHDYTIAGGGTFGLAGNSEELLLHQLGRGVLNLEVGLDLKYSNIFAKSGAGILQLSAAGSTLHGGIITINDGSIRMNHTMALGTGALVFNETDNGLTFSTGIERFHLGGLGGVGDIVLEDTGGNAITLVLGQAGGVATYSGSLSGSGWLEYAAYSDRTNTLAGHNIYTGGTLIRSGTLRVAWGGTLGAETAALEMGGGVLDLYGYSQTVGAFRGTDGIITSSNGAARLTAGASSHERFSGAMTGAVGFTKKGSGSLTFESSATTDYTESTEVEEGALFVNNALTSSFITVHRGATLGGAGEIDEALILQGAIVTPGASAEAPSIGTLNTRSLTVRGGAEATTFRIALNGDGTGTAGVNWSSIAVEGDLLFEIEDEAASPFVIALHSLDLNGEAGALEGWNPYQDQLWEGIFTVSETLSAIDPSRFVVDTTQFQNTFVGTFSVSYNATGTGLDLVYVVPEPHTWGLGLGGVFLLTLWNRRRSERKLS